MKELYGLNRLPHVTEFKETDLASGSQISEIASKLNNEIVEWTEGVLPFLPEELCKLCLFAMEHYSVCTYNPSTHIYRLECQQILDFFGMSITLHDVT